MLPLLDLHVVLRAEYLLKIDLWDSATWKSWLFVRLIENIYSIKRENSIKCQIWGESDALTRDICDAVLFKVGMV